MKACLLTDGGGGAGRRCWLPHATEAHGAVTRLRQTLRWHSLTRRWLTSGHALFAKQGCVVSSLLFLVGEQYIFFLSTKLVVCKANITLARCQGLC